MQLWLHGAICFKDRFCASKESVMEGVGRGGGERGEGRQSYSKYAVYMVAVLVGCR